MKIAYKVWIDNNGKAFGEGPYRLLTQIEKTKSLHQASMDLGISYRKAWLMLQVVEEKLGISFLDRQVGGVSGGGSHMTAEGKAFMRRYEKFRKEIESSLERTYQKHFGQ